MPASSGLKSYSSLLLAQTALCLLLPYREYQQLPSYKIDSFRTLSISTSENEAM